MSRTRPRLWGHLCGAGELSCRQQTYGLEASVSVCDYAKEARSTGLLRELHVPSRTPRVVLQAGLRLLFPLARVVVHLVLNLGDGEHGHEPAANDVREEVAVLDIEPQAHIVTHQPGQDAEAAIDHSAHNVPILLGTGSEHLQDVGAVVQDAEDDGPNDLDAGLAEACTRPLATLRHRPAQLNARAQQVDEVIPAQLQVEEERAEALAVRVQFAGLLPARKVERQGRVEEDEGVRQPANDGRSLESLQRGVRVRRVPAC
mmetsp:Transcript_62484/g.174170  ORF Transcript_62484/g.174170 Transcript_62484/m.174170 type:complete len:259 (+) Transcript_62484:69-845(+)